MGKIPRKEDWFSHLASSQVTVGTRDQSEILRVDVTRPAESIGIYDVCWPPDKSVLESMEQAATSCVVAGDFNSHSDRWAYQETNSTSEEVEDWEIDNNLQLINKGIW